MKICGISDIHGNLLDNVPECDVLCIAGDVITLNAQRNFDASEHWWKNRFVTWVMKLPCKKVLVVPGNHDIYLEHLYNEDKWETFCDYISINTEGKLHFLIDQTFEYQGVTFYGTPWIDPIQFQEDKWAFQVKSYKENNPYSKIPKCDVLITHDSPFENTQLSINSVKTKCKYHFFGHWHDGFECHVNGKYNCSRLNDCYSFKKDFVYPTINIETMEKTKYEILEEFAEKIKELSKEYFKVFDAVTSEDLRTEFNGKIDEILINFLDNPQDTEDEIPWTESSMINEFEEPQIDIDDERK